MISSFVIFSHVSIWIERQNYSLNLNLFLFPSCRYKRIIAFNRMKIGRLFIFLCIILPSIVNFRNMFEDIMKEYERKLFISIATIGLVKPTTSYLNEVCKTCTFITTNFGLLYFGRKVKWVSKVSLNFGLSKFLTTRLCPILNKSEVFGN